MIVDWSCEWHWEEASSGFCTYDGAGPIPGGLTLFRLSLWKTASISGYFQFFVGVAGSDTRDWYTARDSRLVVRGIRNFADPGFPILQDYAADGYFRAVAEIGIEYPLRVAIEGGNKYLISAVRKVSGTGVQQGMFSAQFTRSERLAPPAERATPARGPNVLDVLRSEAAANSRRPVV